jgi:hypothetical protein
MLYDNEDQLEVRHVISLAHYKVDIYGGGERIPEGELWIKRNCMHIYNRLLSIPSAHKFRYSTGSATGQQQHHRREMLLSLLR